MNALTLVPPGALRQSFGMNDASRIEAEILALTSAIGSEKSICPSEVARALDDGNGDDWRRHMHAVRQGAVRLAQAGRIDILRKGKPIAPDTIHGVIRLRLRGEP